MVWSSVAKLNSAGVLAFDTANGWATGQNLPAVTIVPPSDGSLQVGDWYRMVYGTSPSLTTPTYGPWHQISSDNVLGDAVSITYDWGVAQLPSVLTYFACQFGRGVDAAHITLISPLSNIISDTLRAVGATTTFDAANTETHVTVGDGTFGTNLRLFNGVDGGQQCSRTTKQVPDGSKYYWEATLTAFHANGHMLVGVTDGTFVFPTSFGSSPISASKGAGLNNNGLIYPSTSGLGGAAEAAGDIIQCCIKRTGTTVHLWIGHNGVWVGDPSAETGGESITLTDTNCYGFAGVNDSVDEIDVNFGQLAFNYPKPTGATAWQ